jgi:hypothetical protein
MRVSVIVVMPAKPTLRSSSALAFTAAAPGLDIDEPTTKGGLVLDPTFPALPLAAATPAKLSLAAATTKSAPLFVARGTIEADKISQVKAKSGGVQIFADPQVGLFPYCGSGPLGTAKDVARLLDITGLAAKKLTGRRVALAIMDTGINLKHLKAAGVNAALDKTVTWAPAGVPKTPGAYAVDHGTMCAYDALIAAPKATLLDFPILQSTTPGGSVMAGFLSDALLAYSFLQTAINAPGWTYSALVINNSWGMYHPSWDFPAGHPGRYSDNPNHPFNLIVGTMARAGVDILFAAGNCGANCPDGRCQGVVKKTITGANAHPDVLTLAACDTTAKEDRLGYSSQGPAIPKMGANKPDITAYSHFKGSEAFGKGVADSGTSAACPVAAGCVAAIRTRLPSSKTSPAQLFQTLRGSAAPKTGAKAKNDYGAGIIRPVAAATALGL